MPLASSGRFWFGGETIFSPLSGKRVVGREGEPNRQDETLLFIHYDRAGESVLGYLSPRVRDALGVAADAEVLFTDLCRELSIEGALMLEVESEWNGRTFYGFAPR